MRFRLLLLATVLTIGGITGLYWKSKSSTLEATGTPTQNTSLPIRQVVIGDKTFLAELAETTEEQATGLSNRLSLPTNHGMLFPISPTGQISFWMKDMNFGLDFVWIKNNKVVDVTRNVPVPTPSTPTSELKTYTTDQAVDFVLEVNSGAAVTIQPGNAVTISSQ